MICVRFWFLVFLLNYTSFFLHNVSMKVPAISQLTVLYSMATLLDQYWTKLSARTKHAEWNCAPLARTWNKTVHPGQVRGFRYLCLDLPSRPLLTTLNETKLKIKIERVSGGRIRRPGGRVWWKQHKSWSSSYNPLKQLQVWALMFTLFFRRHNAIL